MGSWRATVGRKAKSGGVEPRKCSIRIRFTWNGKRHAEVLTVNDRWIQDTDKGVQRRAIAEAFTSGQINESVQCRT